jgi:hypothetical protein
LLTYVILATREADIRKITVRGQLRPKVSDIPISINKLSMVVSACHPSYAGGIDRRIDHGPGIKQDST